LKGPHSSRSLAASFARPNIAQCLVEPFLATKRLKT